MFAILPNIGCFAYYYDLGTDALVADPVMGWAGTDSHIEALTLDRENGRLVPADSFANFVVVLPKGADATPYLEEARKKLAPLLKEHEDEDTTKVFSGP